MDEKKSVGMRNKRMKIFQVDSFTSKPFTGNPAGVYSGSFGLLRVLHVFDVQGAGRQVNAFMKYHLKSA